MQIRISLALLFALVGAIVGLIIAYLNGSQFAVTSQIVQKPDDVFVTEMSTDTNGEIDENVISLFYELWSLRQATNDIKAATDIVNRLIVVGETDEAVTLVETQNVPEVRLEIIYGIIDNAILKKRVLNDASLSELKLLIPTSAGDNVRDVWLRIADYHETQNQQPLVKAAVLKAKESMGEIEKPLSFADLPESSPVSWYTGLARYGLSIPILLSIFGFIIGGLSKPIIEAYGKAVLGRKIAEIIKSDELKTELEGEKRANKK